MWTSPFREIYILYNISKFNLSLTLIIYFFNNNPVIGLNLSIPFNTTVLLSVFLISFLPVIFAI